MKRTSPSQDTTPITKQTDLQETTDLLVAPPTIIKNQISHAVLTLQTNQAIALKALLHRTIIICSIYIPPKHKLNKTEIKNLMEQFPTPIILMRDFNACSKMLGCNDHNLTGKILESILESPELCILNDKTHTYLQPGTGTISAIDLT